MDSQERSMMAVSLLTRMEIGLVVIVLMRKRNRTGNKSRESRGCETSIKHCKNDQDVLCEHLKIAVFFCFGYRLLQLISEYRI